MKFGLTSPCADCPFLKEPYFFLEQGRRKEIAEALLHDQTFPCHKTVDYSKYDQHDGVYVFTPEDKTHQCAGALITMKKGKELFSNFLFRLAVMAKMFDPDKLNMKTNTYNSLSEFIGDQLDETV